MKFYGSIVTAAFLALSSSASALTCEVLGNRGTPLLSFSIVEGDDSCTAIVHIASAHTRYDSRTGKYINVKTTREVCKATKNGFEFSADPWDKISLSERTSKIYLHSNATHSNESAEVDCR